MECLVHLYPDHDFCGRPGHLARALLATICQRCFQVGIQFSGSLITGVARGAASHPEWKVLDIHISRHLAHGHFKSQPT